MNEIMNMNMNMNGNGIAVQNISGVDCYEKDGMAYLKLEAVARGLGFTTTQTVDGREYTNVRWKRVDDYLNELGFATSGKRPEYIPENIFYRLAMKAKNETAERFQALVADEIIPSIRRHGAYMTPQTLQQMISSPEFGIQLLTALKDERDKAAALSRQIEADAPKVAFAEDVEASHGTVTMQNFAQMVYPLTGMGRNNLYKQLRAMGILQDNNAPYQKYLNDGYFQRTEVVKNGQVYPTTLVTGKGQTYLHKRLAALFGSTAKLAQ